MVGMVATVLVGREAIEPAGRVAMVLAGTPLALAGVVVANSAVWEVVALPVVAVVHRVGRVVARLAHTLVRQGVVPHTRARPVLVACASGPLEPGWVVLVLDTWVVLVVQASGPSVSSAPEVQLVVFGSLSRGVRLVGKEFGTCFESGPLHAESAPKPYRPVGALVLLSAGLENGQWCWSSG